MKKDSNLINNHNFQHPLFGISIKNWIQLLEKNGKIDKDYLMKGIFITLTSILTSPARILFKKLYNSKINNSIIKHPPVIIIGHWRTGTTFLHELLSHDPQFCYVSLWNTMLPDSFLILDPLKNFLANFLPTKRPMDEIRVDIDGPYEEEAGLAVLNLWSFFHCFHFPRNAEEQFLKSLYFENLNKKEIDQWKKNYIKFMKTVIFANNDKRLLIKNPANTARISMLLELFPDAKFIHIYRNPYIVYLSTIKMRNKVLDELALQNTKKEEIEQQVIEYYKRVMKSYFKQKNQIPKENIIEIKYEDLVSNPVKLIKNIYSQLKIPGIQNALLEMNKYLEKQKNYKTNIYSIDKKIINRVKSNWNFTIDLWEYKPPDY